MNTFAWAVPMAVTAVSCEYMYRRLGGQWVDYWWLWTPLHMLMGYLVYRVVVSADSLLAAFIVGNFVTSGMRILVTVAFLDDRITPGTWAGFALLILANTLRFYWR